MNKQLALIDTTTIDQLTEKSLPHRPKKQRARVRSEEWWKLSREEKQQGLAGVRAIRAILQKNGPEHDISMAKAS